MARGNRYSKGPLRKAGAYLVRLTAEERNVADWLARKKANAKGDPAPITDVLRLALTPEVVALVMAGKL